MNGRNDTRNVHDCRDCLSLQCDGQVPPVTFESPCERRDAHGKHRWSVKIDPALPPTDANAIQSVTPSDIYSWPGPDVPLTQSSERTGIENKWFALTGRVIGLKVEFPEKKNKRTLTDKKKKRGWPRIRTPRILARVL